MRRVLKEGKLKEPCHARTLLAHTLNNQERRAEAIEEFERAAKSKACAEEAEAWIEFLKQQEQLEKKTQRGSEQQSSGTSPR